MRRPPVGDLALVAAGSAAGASLRWAVSQAEHGAALLWVTLAVNVVGAFVLGALPGLAPVRRSRRATLVLGPGVLGGFTTVSAWAGQTTGLAQDDQGVLAAVYVVTTVAGALLAARLGRRWAASRGVPA